MKVENGAEGVKVDDKIGIRYWETVGAAGREMSVWAPIRVRGGTYVGFERLYTTGFEMSEREGLFKGVLGKEKAACDWINECKQTRGNILLKRMLGPCLCILMKNCPRYKVRGKMENIVCGVGCRYTLTVVCKFATRGMPPDIIETFSVHRRKEYDGL